MINTLWWPLALKKKIQVKKKFDELPRWIDKNINYIASCEVQIEQPDRKTAIELLAKISTITNIHCKIDPEDCTAELKCYDENYMKPLLSFLIQHFQSLVPQSTVKFEFEHAKKEMGIDKKPTIVRYRVDSVFCTWAKNKMILEYPERSKQRKVISKISRML